jgi:hypothetical protein
MKLSAYVTPKFVKEFAREVNSEFKLDSYANSYYTIRPEVSKRVYEHLGLSSTLGNLAREYYADFQPMKGYEFVHRSPSILAALSDVVLIPDFSHLVVNSSHSIADVFGSMKSFDQAMRSHGAYFGFDLSTGLFDFNRVSHLENFTRNSISTRILTNNFSPVLVSSDRNDNCLTHWLWNRIPQLLRASQLICQLKNPILITSYPLAKWQIESLAVFAPDLACLQIKVVSEAVLFDRIFTVFGSDNWFLDGEFIRSVKKIVDFDSQVKSDNLSQRVYLSRDDAATRRVVNEVEVMNLLDRYGFSKVIMTNLSFFEQARLLNSAKHIFFIAGSHGALLPFINNEAVVTVITNGYCPELLNGWQLYAPNVGVDKICSISATPVSVNAGDRASYNNFNDDLHLNIDMLEKFLEEQATSIGL